MTDQDQPIPPLSQRLLKNPFVYMIGVIIVMWMIALAYAEPIREYPEPLPVVYSFPPKCPEVPVGSVPTQEIARMARELGLNPIYSAEYYANQFGSCFLPTQIPVIYENRAAYEREIENYWKK